MDFPNTVVAKINWKKWFDYDISYNKSAQV